MKCSYCSTKLPTGALFCGECGRGVAPVSRRRHRSRASSVPTALARTRFEPAQAGLAGIAPSGTAASRDSDQFGGAFAPANSALADGPDSWKWSGAKAIACQSCGAGMLADEIFCGTCGAVSQAVASNYGSPGDTVVFEWPAPLSAAGHAGVQSRAPLHEPAPVVPPTDRYQSPVGGENNGHNHGEYSRDAVDRDDSEDLESTRIFQAKKLEESFVLQFSTGERSTVFGSGLIGRNPVTQPGEFFDQLVRVIDPSRSVSKTHLEFGQEGGSFWVMDRYSGNGTVLREPDASAVRCQPARRYRVPRGTRIEIGEQFFVVS